MRIIINDTEKNIPSSLSEMTLGERIGFHNTHGRELEQMAISIIAMEEGPLKEIEVAEYNVTKMIRTMSFFTGFTVASLEQSGFIDEIAVIYHSAMSVLFDDEAEVELAQSYEWNGEKWELHPPELKNNSHMKFGEFVDSKQVIKDLSELAAGKWEQMLHLCAIYLRRPGEPYREEFLYEGSERLELMRTLPMDIALAVGFFLSSSMHISIAALRSSTSRPSSQGRTKKSTSTVGAG